MRSRWEARYGVVDGKVAVPWPANGPMPHAIAKAVDGKREYERVIAANKRAIADAEKRNTVPLSECVRVAELLAGKRKGRLYPAALGKRLATATPPSTTQQERVIGAKWRLRGVYLELLLWIIAAQRLFVWRDRKRLGARGVYGTQAELGKLLGSALAPALSGRRVREVLHELRRWGLVRATPSFVALGAVTSQRASG